MVTINQTKRQKLSSDTPSVNKAMRLEARVTAQSLEIIRRAAELNGQSISNFVVAAAEESARRAIDNAHVIRLSLDDQRLFASSLTETRPLPAAMDRAKAAHETLIRNRVNADISD